MATSPPLRSELEASLGHAARIFDELYDRLDPDLFSWLLGVLRVLENSLNIRCARGGGSGGGRELHQA